MLKKKIIIVDKNDSEIGTGEKLITHKEGKLHRAFSVFLFNSKGEMLIQKRAKTKYHSPSLWSNACCSHPRPNQKLEKEVKKRLKEEMGIECDLKEIFSFVYKAKIGNLIEHEFDHVFLGKFNGKPKPNKEEVQAWEWITIKNLIADIKKNPQNYTYWFKLILNRVLKERTKYG